MFEKLEERAVTLTEWRLHTSTAMWGRCSIIWRHTIWRRLACWNRIQLLALHTSDQVKLYHVSHIIWCIRSDQILIRSDQIKSYHHHQSDLKHHCSTHQNRQIVWLQEIRSVSSVTEETSLRKYTKFARLQHNTSQSWERERYYRTVWTSLYKKYKSLLPLRNTYQHFCIKQYYILASSQKLDQS